MKKILVFLSIATFLSVVTQSVTAAPHGGPGGDHGGGGPHMEHRGDYRPMPNFHRYHHNGIMLGVSTGPYYLNYPYYSCYGMGMYNNLYDPCYPCRRLYGPNVGGGIYVNF